MEECMKERYGLAKERIREIITEETVKKPFGDFFRNRAKFLSMAADVMDESAAELTMEALKERNHCFYQDILPENYESSYGNPAYAVQQMGEYGKAFSFLYAEIAGTVAYAHEKRLWDMTVSMELFLEVYSAFCEEELPEAAIVEGILRSYVNDYCQDMMEKRIREGVDPELDFAADIIMNSDLSDLRYLYKYGEYVSENEIGVAEFLNSLSQDEIDKMASAVSKMVHDSVASYVQRDLELAREVIEQDDAVDELFETVKKKLMRLISAGDEDGSTAIDLIMVSKYLERIGDHATNIAEWVEFSITGVHKESHI